MVVSLTSGCGRFRWESKDSNVNSKGNRQTTEQEELADQENTTDQESTADQGQAQSGSKGAESMKEPLPRFYDARQDGRTSMVKDQGERGTCWAFASMQALESSLLPEESYDFSEDHMVHDPDFILNSEEGGDYVMAMAYLLSWRGPVLESQDPYGDGISPDGLLPVKHVQEIRLLPEGDREAIKRAVYTTGGVQSSLYTALQKAGADTAYYNQETQAYCYQGEEVPNHDVVIVGWDDDYPAENFSELPPDDGAFLCENSWGTEFGEAGFFYVSYYDTNLGTTNLVYSGVEPADNYDRIYQSDQCGWLGQIGYGSETVWGANVYAASGGAQKIRAAGFYAVDAGTEYEISVVTDVPEQPTDADWQRLKRKKSGTVSGKLQYAGYYTIPLSEPVEVPDGGRFAMLVELHTPGAVHPMAIEYDSEDGRSLVDITDGEGYLSADGDVWERVETEQECNLCLKAYSVLK